MAAFSCPAGITLKEQALWRLTNVPLAREVVTVVSQGESKEVATVRPRGAWYLSVGQGMGKTILVAGEKQAYTLADRGTYYSLALAEPPRTDLVIVHEGDPNLHNPYGVIAVNPDKHPGGSFEGAKKYIEWITSPEVQAMIGRYRVGGKVLFHPNALRARAE